MSSGTSHPSIPGGLKACLPVPVDPDGTSGTIARILGSKEGSTSVVPNLALVTTVGSDFGTDAKSSGGIICGAPTGATVGGAKYAMFVSFAVFYFLELINAYPLRQYLTA
jgi:hypothetical protein